MIAAVEMRIERNGAHPRNRQAERAISFWGRFAVASVVICWGVGIAVSFSLAVALITAFGFAAAVVGMRQRFLSLLGMGVLCTVDPVTRGFVAYSSPEFRWNSLNYFLLAVMICNVPLLFKMKGTSVRLFQILIILLAVEIAIGGNLGAGALQVLNVATCLGIVVYFLRSWRSGNLWYWFSLICGLTAAVGGFVFYHERKGLPDVNINAVAQFPLTGIIAICVGVSLARLSKDAIGKRRQLILGLIASVNFGWVFLTGSRGALLTASLCIIYLPIAISGVVTRLALIAGSVLLCGLILVNYTEVQSATLQRIDRAFDTSLAPEERTSGRSDLALGGWYILQDHPFGVGTGGFSEAWSKLGKTRELSGYAQGSFKESHSGWIKILAENGAPGILLLVTFVLSFVVTSYRSRCRELFIFGLFVSSCFGVALLSTEFQSKGLWLMIAALLAALNVVDVRTRKRQLRRRIAIRRRSGPEALANA